MEFEARELKPGAEFVLPEELVVGKAYFSVTYGDEKLLVPLVETLVFIGRNLEKGDSDLLYFQDHLSYSNGRLYGDAVAGDEIYVSTYHEGKTNPLFDFEHALEELMACSLRRRDAGL
jgi:hypothetical protein